MRFKWAWTASLGIFIQFFAGDLYKFSSMSRGELADTFSINNLVTRPEKVNMELLTMLAWILIFFLSSLFSFLALKFKTIRVISTVISIIPFIFILAYFLFKIPTLPLDEDHKKLFFTNFKVGGHRGSVSPSAPENSLEAMTAVVKHGGQLAEIDIHLTSDGVAVISHDGNVVRATGVDKDISKMTLEEFKTLRYINTNISLPTFAEAVQHCVSNNIMMIWDVKSVNSELLTAFVTQIRTHNLYDKVLITGFNPIDMFMVKKADSKILTGFTFRTWELSTTDEAATQLRFAGVLNAIAQLLDVIAFALARSLIIPKFLGSDMIFYHVNDASAYLAAEALQNDMHLGVWTSNNKIEQRWLRDHLKVPFLTDDVAMVPK
ncbi:unnamed protein product [Caenorhabditis bovis]|uniref:GP-PDE domain-containing protein n=1 Tax=Caenorhabditis bovis TaxID=2654633 RepID=A0A8S1EIK9_9PELO|nr:unnamed protein product [Caenorhabditis bovis]